MPSASGTRATSRRGLATRAASGKVLAAQVALLRHLTGAGGDTVHHVQHAGRHAGALRQLGHGERRQRRLLGRLDDHGAACGDGFIQCR